MKKKAFTLIEILIATTIFSVVLLLTTATVGESSGFQSKTVSIRNSTEETRKLADTLTTEIRQANGEMRIKINDADPAQVYPSGLAMFSCEVDESGYLITSDYSDTLNPEPGIACSRVDYLDQGTATSGAANTLVVNNAKNNEHVIYFSSPSSGYQGNVVFRRGISSSDYPLDGTSSLSLIRQIAAFVFIKDPTDMTSGNQCKSFDGSASTTGCAYAGTLEDEADTDAFLYMTGLAPSKEAVDANGNLAHKPYINFQINSKTKNFDEKTAAERFDTWIRSTVSTRNYAGSY